MITTSEILMFGALMTASFGGAVSGTPRESSEGETTAPDSGVYGFTMKNIDGKDLSLSTYKGKILLAVNVASHCGNTPQYADLEALYRKFKDRGFMILGFPANNFGGQEPGSDSEIKEFCSTAYGVTFDMFSKISVKGDDQHPLYAYLTSGKSNPMTKGEVKWNFQKYLIDRSGKVIAVFAPKVKPLSKELVAAVEAALSE